MLQAGRSWHAGAKDCGVEPTSLVGDLDTSLWHHWVGATRAQLPIPNCLSPSRTGQAKISVCHRRQGFRNDGPKFSCYPLLTNMKAHRRPYMEDTRPSPLTNQEEYQGLGWPWQRFMFRKVLASLHLRAISSQGVHASNLGSSKGTIPVVKVWSGIVIVPCSLPKQCRDSSQYSRPD